MLERPDGDWGQGAVSACDGATSSASALNVTPSHATQGSVAVSVSTRRRTQQRLETEKQLQLRAQALDRTEDVPCVDPDVTQVKTTDVTQVKTTTGVKNHQKHKICIPKCKVRGGKTEDAAVVQCHMCQTWVHPPCVGEQDEDIIGIWTCSTCRATPSMINTILNTLRDIQRENIEIRAHVTEEVNDIRQELKIDKELKYHRMADTLATKSREHIELLKENATLRQKVSDLTNKMESQQWQKFRNSSNDHTVVFGSSIIKDISESRLVNTDVICKPGGKINDISDVVSKCSTDKTYDRAVLVVGGNDCDPRERTDDRTASDIIAEYRTLAKVTKSRANSVTVSSICPRIKSVEVKNKIDSVNAGLQVMCEEENVTFVDNEPSCQLRDGSINDGYLAKDGVHLTWTATNKLAQNLKLKRKDGIDSVIVQRQGYQKGNHGKTRTNNERDDTKDQTTGWSTVNRRHRQKTHNRHNHENPRSERHSREVCCYFCGESGHVKDKCHHGKQVQCRICFEFGHKQKFCNSNANY